MSKVPKFQFEDYPSAKTAKVAKLYSAESPQATTTEARPLTCESCSWYELNPWTRDPALGAWCHFRMEHLVVGSAACEEFSRGEMSPRQPPKQAPAVPATVSPASLEPSLSGASAHPCRLPPLQSKLWPESPAKVGEEPKSKPEVV